MVSIIKNDVFVVKDTGEVVSLIYKYRENGVDYFSIRKGSVKGWRRKVFLYGVEEFKAKREETEYLPGVRMSILIRTLPTIRNKTDAFEMVGIVKDMAIEELSFWTWKLNQLGRDAAKAIKVMYGVR